MSSTSVRKLPENRMRKLRFAEIVGNASEACRKLEPALNDKA